MSKKIMMYSNEEKICKIDNTVVDLVNLYKEAILFPESLFFIDDSSLDMETFLNNVPAPIEVPDGHPLRGVPAYLACIAIMWSNNIPPVIVEEEVSTDSSEEGSKTFSTFAELLTTAAMDMAAEDMAAESK